MREPPFWWRRAGVASALLSPFAALYGGVAAQRLKRRGRRMGVPVVCIGNPTVGGAGKTPAALTVARMLQAEGERPAFLSRGYGGTMPGPVLVDPLSHRASDVGDEPLLLARVATTVVAHDRVKGAQMAVSAGASVLVMDDGFQNPSLAKDFSALVVDGRRGIGNGRVIPAGPLRAPLRRQLDRAHALIAVGGAAPERVTAEARARSLPVFGAGLAPEAGFVEALGGERVLAFAGIGDPEKFFATLRDAGIAITETRSFDDHHRYTRAEAQTLCENADRDGLILVTTEKDLVRMQGDAETAELAAAAHALPVMLQFDDEAGFGKLLREAIARARATKGEGLR